MRVAIATLGCRLNHYESDAMRFRLRTRAGVEDVAWDAQADVYVINACTVTAEAASKCRQLARAVRRRAPRAKLVVAGCLPQHDPGQLGDALDVDALLGNDEKRRLDEFLPAILAAGTAAPLRAVATAAPRSPLAGDEQAGPTEHARAVLKVQEGCDLRCTFCAVWRARGPARSLAPRAVVEQARWFASEGHAELVLAGVHLADYGRDLSPQSSLSDLIALLLAELPTTVRLRISSFLPSGVTPALVALMAAEQRLCPYVHLAVQSGSDTVLRRMGRPYRAATVERAVGALMEVRPNLGVGADLMVGFPGETEADFQQTRALVERLPVSFYHVFRYSVRRDTKAARMDGHVPPAVSARRSAQLRALGAERRSAFLRSHLGDLHHGIVEGARDAQGRHEIMLGDHATVWANVEPVRPRQVVWVRADRMEPDGRLIGERVEPPLALPHQGVDRDA